MWDLQDIEIPSYGKRTVDVEFAGDEAERLKGSLRMGVSEVGRNVASMRWLLRDGFDLRFAEGNHRCWMSPCNQITFFYQGDPTSEASR